MIVKGRDKPALAVVMNDDGSVTFRIDFALRDEAWVEITLTPAELAALAHSEPLEKP